MMVQNSLARLVSYPLAERLKECDLTLSQLHRRLQEAGPITYQTLLAWKKKGQVNATWLQHVEMLLGSADPQAGLGLLPMERDWLQWALTDKDGDRYFIAAGNALSCLLAGTMEKGVLLYARHDRERKDHRGMVTALSPWWFEYEWLGLTPWRRIAGSRKELTWRSSADWLGRSTGRVFTPDGVIGQIPCKGLIGYSPADLLRKGGRPVFPEKENG